MKRFGLAYQILLGLVLGVFVGALFYGQPQVETYLQPIGDIFLNLIKMIVAPIVISTLVVGVAGTGNFKKLGKLGGKSILYFEIITTMAIIVGLFVANVVQPGAGVNMKQLEKTNIQQYMETAQHESHHDFVETFVHIVPANVFKAFTEGDLLAIIFFAVMLGLALAAIGEKGEPVLAFFQGLSAAMFWMTNKVMHFAPFGVFALIGVTISKFGLHSLIPLAKLVLSVYGAMIFFIIVVFGLVARFVAGIHIFALLHLLKDELLLAYTTASSEAVMPKLMEKMERFGCSKTITSFVIPTGYSFNLDGSTLYQALAALFIAQMYGINMPLSQQLTLLLVLMITSKGIAGVPGVSFVVLLATLGSVGIPVEGLAFIAGIDRILDMARTVVNVVGNSLATVVIAKWEKQYDQQKGEEYLKQLKAA